MHVSGCTEVFSRVFKINFVYGKDTTAIVVRKIKVFGLLEWFVIVIPKNLSFIMQTQYLCVSNWKLIYHI